MRERDTLSLPGLKTWVSREFKMTEIAKNESYSAHPSELVAILCGNEDVSLGGFGAAPMPKSWVRPGMRFVSAHETPASEALAAQHMGFLLLAIRFMTMGLLFFAGVGLGTWIGAYTPEKSSSQLWFVAGIGINEVQVSMDDKKVSVLIGDNLPNGETILATMPDQRAYLTNKSTTVLNTEKNKSEASQ